VIDMPREWTSENEDVWTSEESEPVTIVIGGKEVTVDPEEYFVDTIKSLAREHGIGKFVVKVDGREISPEDAPETFEDLNGYLVRIEPIDEAGL